MISLVVGDNREERILGKEGVGDHWVLARREGKWFQERDQGTDPLVLMLKTNKYLMRS